MVKFARIRLPDRYSRYRRTGPRAHDATATHFQHRQGRDYQK